MNKGQVVSVRYGADGGFVGDWKTELRDQFDAPMNPLNKEALDRLLFMADNNHIVALLARRRHRAEAIQAHFRQAANQLIEKIEKSEGWEDYGL